jgi:hypothetical protein
MIMGFSRIMRDALYPLLVGFNAIPKATVVPIVALMFVGQHDFNTVLLAFMISFFPDRGVGLDRPLHAGTGIPRYPALSGRLASHDLLENRAAQNAA